MSEEIVTDKEKAEMVDDLVELLGCKWFEVYSKVALAFEMTLSDSEIFMIKEARRIKEKYLNKDACDSSGQETAMVFAGPKEDFKDWPEDRNEFPQKGLGK